MQALEWGDRDMVVRLACGAMLRIYEDGRLGCLRQSRRH
jgi:hypothetical protein